MFLDDNDLNNNNKEEKKEEIEEDEDCNILLIGPSGSGKSLLINSFITYLKYNDLEEAIKESTLENLATIPTYISMNDGDGNDSDGNNEPFQITLGNLEENEKQRIINGQSVTSVTKKYSIKLSNNKTICFIDTPGLLDSDGYEKDCLNFENILIEINKLKKLNAICIVLKPNENRTNSYFKFCINELLSHLHISAKDNIFFLISSIRSSNYRVHTCETKKLLEIQLKKLKEKNNTLDIELNKKLYSFDNESFNYIALIKSGYKNFSNFEETLYNLSWTNSVQELTRLLKDIISITPHDIQNTISINLARKMINQLIHPISICVLNISENKKVIEAKKFEIENNLNCSDNDIESLKQKLLFTPFINIKSLKLDNRKTICTNQKCLINSKNEKLTTTKDGKIVKLNYCCDNCNISNNKKDHPSEGSSIYKCSNINLFGFCKSCKCHFSRHINIDTIEEREEIQLSLDPTLEFEIKTKEETLLIANNFISELESTINQYLLELKIIGMASIEFSCFLYKNSLIEYNDEIEGYLQYLIKNEQQNSSSTTTNNNIENLKNYLESHKKEINRYKKDLELKRNEKLKVLKDKENERGLFYQPTQQDLEDDEKFLSNFDNDSTSIKSALEIKLKIDEILNLKYSGPFIKSKLNLFESINNEIITDNNNNNNINNINHINIIENNTSTKKRNSNMYSKIFNSFSTSPK